MISHVTMYTGHYVKINSLCVDFWFLVAAAASDGAAEAREGKRRRHARFLPQ